MLSAPREGKSRTSRQTNKNRKKNKRVTFACLVLQKSRRETSCSCLGRCFLSFVKSRDTTPSCECWDRMSANSCRWAPSLFPLPQKSCMPVRRNGQQSVQCCCKFTFSDLVKHQQTNRCSYSMLWNACVYKSFAPLLLIVFVSLWLLFCSILGAAPPPPLPHLERP